MRIGIPKEIKDREERVACTPDGVRQLVERGHEVRIQRRAGTGCGFADEVYRAAGGRISESAAEVYGESELIVKVKEPQPAEYAYLRSEHILFSYLHLAAEPTLTQALIERGTTAIAFDTVQAGRWLPLLEPMSEIAGRMSAVVGAELQARGHGGGGVLLGGVPGVLPGRVVVLGGGTAGYNAARVAAGMGADVTILEVDPRRLRQLEHQLPANVRTEYSTEQNLMRWMPQADVLIGAVLLPGAKAPRLIRREMLRAMKPGSGLVDIAIDQGGCAETSRPTSHSQPTFEDEGVVRYCVTNMPGAYARTATHALAVAVMPYLLRIADTGWQAAVEALPELSAGVNVAAGAIIHPAVAQAYAAGGGGLIIAASN